MLFSVFCYGFTVKLLKNRTKPLLLAAIIMSASSIPLFFLNDDTSTNWLIYILSAFQGVGLSIQSTIASSLISDVIGKNEGGSSFVYGMYGLLDKIANGVILFILVDKFSEADAAMELRVILGIGPAICSFLLYILSVVGTMTYSQRLAKLSIFMTAHGKQSINLRDKAGDYDEDLDEPDLK